MSGRGIKWPASFKQWLFNTVVLLEQTELVSTGMPPRRVLHVAEKPAVAKELAAVLSGGRQSRRQGPSQYNCIWEFSSDFQGTPSVSFHVTSVTGHLMLVC